MDCYNYAEFSEPWQIYEIFVNFFTISWLCSFQLALNATTLALKEFPRFGCHIDVSQKPGFRKFLVNCFVIVKFEQSPAKHFVLTLKFVAKLAIHSV